MVVVPLPQPENEFAPARRGRKTEPPNWVRIVASGSLVAGGLLLLNGRHRAGLAVAARARLWPCLTKKKCCAPCGMRFPTISTNSRDCWARCKTPWTSFPSSANSFTGFSQNNRGSQRNQSKCTPETTAFKSTRPPGSSDPSRNSTGYNNSGSALNPQQFWPSRLMRWGVHLGSHTKSTFTLLISGMPAKRLCTCSKMSPLAGHCGVVRVMVTLTHWRGHAGFESGSGPVSTS